MAGQSSSVPLVLLLDSRLSGDKYWLHERLEAKGFHVSALGIPTYNMRNRKVRWRKLLLWWQYFSLGYRGARLANRMNAIIVAWNPIAGAFAAQFVPRGTRKVIALNMIAYDKGVINHALRSLVYRRGFSSGRMIATANSTEVRNHYIALFKIPPDQISVLHDSWDPRWEICPPTITDEDFVFSGGEAARDWASVSAVAAQLPEIRFKVVARRMNWAHTSPVPSNMEVFFDLTEDQFYSMVKRSRIVLLSVKGNITAGLMLLMKSALLGKVVISTQTMATEAYYPDTCKDLLLPEGDIEGVTSVVSRYHSNPDLVLRKASMLQSFVRANYTPEGFSSRVSELVYLAANQPRQSR